MKQVVTPSVCQIWQRAIINNVQKGGPLTTEGKLLYSELASRCCPAVALLFRVSPSCRGKNIVTRKPMVKLFLRFLFKYC